MSDSDRLRHMEGIRCRHRRQKRCAAMVVVEVLQSVASPRMQDGMMIIAHAFARDPRRAAGDPIREDASFLIPVTLHPAKPCHRGKKQWHEEVMKKAIHFPGLGRLMDMICRGTPGHQHLVNIGL